MWGSHHQDAHACPASALLLAPSSQPLTGLILRYLLFQEEFLDKPRDLPFEMLGDIYSILLQCYQN